MRRRATAAGSAFLREAGRRQPACFVAACGCLQRLVQFCPTQPASSASLLNLSVCSLPLPPSRTMSRYHIRIKGDDSGSGAGGSSAAGGKAAGSQGVLVGS